MIRSSSCAFAAALLCGASVALAAARIGVVPFAPLAGDVPQGAGEKGADILAKELKNQADFDVVPRAEAASQDGAAAISQARQKVAEARAALAKHQGTAAVAAYEAALAGFAKGTSELDSFEEFIAAEAELGTVLYRLGRDDEGQAALLDAARLSAGVPLKAAAASPTYAAALEALQKEAGKLGKGSIRVESTPSGADLYVDGQAAGKAPVLLRALPAGKHYVRALLPSGERWGAIVDVTPKGEGQLRAQTGGGGPGGDVAAQLAENSLQPGVVASLQKVAAAQKLAYVVLGALHRTLNGLALDAFLFSAERGTLSRLKRVAFDAELLEAGLQMDKIVAELQQRLTAGPEILALPAKVALDLAAERELATEYHFGGTPDAPLDTPAAASSDEPNPEGGRRVIHKTPQDAD